jgi:hypothetical protein
MVDVARRTRKLQFVLDQLSVHVVGDCEQLFQYLGLGLGPGPVAAGVWKMSRPVLCLWVWAFRDCRFFCGLKETDRLF